MAAVIDILRVLATGPGLPIPANRSPLHIPLQQLNQPPPIFIQIPKILSIRRDGNSNNINRLGMVLNPFQAITILHNSRHSYFNRKLHSHYHLDIGQLNRIIASSVLVCFRICSLYYSGYDIFGVYYWGFELYGGKCGKKEAFFEEVWYARIRVLLGLAGCRHSCRDLLAQLYA